MTKDEFSLEALENALKTLKKAFELPSLDELQRDGAIQRFEYTVELSWKMMRKYLILAGMNDIGTSPKNIIREAFADGLISDARVWLDFIEKRNLASHIYNQTQANDIFNVAKTLPPFVDELIHNIQSKLKK